jgi:YD repeat-containing protein
MPFQDEERPITVDVPNFLGLNTVQKPGSLVQGQWRAMKNAYQADLGDCTKRPGSVPVTTAALAATIKYMTEFKATASNVTPDLLATSGTTLYKYDGASTLTAQTMTNALTSSDIYSVPFTNAGSVSILFITDGGSVKRYNAGSPGAVVNITPAADDAAPAPANNLTALNAKLPIYCWVHKDYLFISDGKDAIYYAKKFQFDYFPTTYFNRFVRANDYITGPGITYSDVCMIPMRRGWGMLTGSEYNDFNGNVFLNTVNGCISGRSIQRITRPDGTQSILYLSDDGVYEIFDTGAINSGSRQYSTRALMKEKIDFNAIGFTDAEKKAAASYFDVTFNLYMLIIKRGTTSYAYCMDIRNGEWYVWTNIIAESLIRSNGTLYFGGTDRLLKKFDPTLASDWNESTKTTGTPVDWDVITDVIALEESGFASMLDYILIWAKQYSSKSTIDLFVNKFSGTDEYDALIKNQYMIWGTGIWGQAAWYNLNFTDLVGKPVRKPYKKKSYFFQLRFHNNRDELVKLYHYKLTGRSSGQ